MPDEKEDKAIINVGNVKIDLKDAPKQTRKIVETLFGGGLIFRPWLTRRQAQADHDKAVLEAKADVESGIIRAEGQVKIDLILSEGEQRKLELAALRKAHRAIQQQTNLEAIAQMAIEFIPEEISDEPVSQDFTNTWIDCAQDASNEQVQKLWGKVLAGEVAKPGSFSRKTLAVLKDMEQVDAELFSYFCRLVVSLGEEASTCITGTGAEAHHSTAFKNIARDFAIREVEISHLEALGLVSNGAFPAFFTEDLDTDHGAHLDVTYGSTVYRVMGQGPFQTLVFRHVPLTRAGNELRTLVEFEPSEAYGGFVLQLLRNQNLDISVIEKSK